ncbi:MAG: metal ABC transporter permease [Actinobacteria bacterium]|nr:metal ABC transporter permease [Actinomycetota bacterium]
MIGAIPLPYPFDAAFMQRALAACVVVGVFAPVIGTFLVQRRLSLVGDGIGHVAFAGVGAGLLAGVWPVWTALAFAVAGAVGVEYLRMRKKASGDLALALFFYAGIALGVVFASRAGNGSIDFETLPYLFGDPFRVSDAGVGAVILLGTGITAGVWALRRVLFAIVTDEDWARVAGLPVDAMNAALAALTAAAIVAAMKIVGILLVAALMALPVATAQLLARSFRDTMRLGVAIGAGSAVIGLALSRPLNLSPGGAIVMVAAALFAVVAVAKRTVPLLQGAH